MTLKRQHYTTGPHTATGLDIAAGNKLQSSSEFYQAQQVMRLKSLLQEQRKLLATRQTDKREVA